MTLNALEDLSAEEEFYPMVPLLSRASSAARWPASTSVVEEDTLGCYQDSTL